jgi:hypothetical protein
MWKLIVGLIAIFVGSIELYWINEEEKAAAWNYHARKEQLFFTILISGGVFLIYKFWRGRITNKFR